MFYNRTTRKASKIGRKLNDNYNQVKDFSYDMVMTIQNVSKKQVWDKGTLRTFPFSRMITPSIVNILYKKYRYDPPDAVGQ